VKWTDIFEDTICYRLALHFLAIFQVPPAELEHILHTNPEIADAAVVPYVSTALINHSSLCVYSKANQKLFSIHFNAFLNHSSCGSHRNTFYFLLSFVLNCYLMYIGPEGVDVIHLL